MKPTDRPDHHRVRSAALLLAALAYVAVMTYEFSDLRRSLQEPPADHDRRPAQPNEAVLSHVQALDEPMLRVEEEAATPVVRMEEAATPAPTTVIRGRETMVFIVNFRDSKRCGETLQSMFENAAAPELLKVSLHDQILEAQGELQCVDAYCQRVGERHCRRAQIVSTKVDAKDAKGPTVARHITEQALGDEEFCLGLDSHMIFVPGWDTQLVQHWDSIENPNAIITMYPKSSEYLVDHSMDHKMGLMCGARIESEDFDAVVQYLAVNWFVKANATKPKLMAQFAGGFNFGNCRSYKEVPNDPYTPILFYGEEYHRAARLWTHGYDFYAPSIDVVYHWYETRGKIWDENWPERYQMMMRSKRRMRHVLGLPVSSDDFDHTDLDKYALGTKRTFEQFVKFSGIDPLAKQNKTQYEQFRNCDDLEFVPFT